MKNIEQDPTYTWYERTPWWPATSIQCLCDFPEIPWRKVGKTLERTNLEYNYPFGCKALPDLLLSTLTDASIIYKSILVGSWHYAYCFSYYTIFLVRKALCLYWKLPFYCCLNCLLCKTANALFLKVLYPGHLQRMSLKILTKKEMKILN